MDAQRKLLALCLCLIVQAIKPSLAGEEYDVKEQERKQKNYEEEEEGKVLPHKTFLSTLEITLICIFTVIGVFLIIFCCIYLYYYGCRCPRWCVKCCTRDTSKDDYSQVQLHRERKIGEIWKQNHC